MAWTKLGMCLDRNPSGIDFVDELQSLRGYHPGRLLMLCLTIEVEPGVRDQD